MEMNKRRWGVWGVPNRERIDEMHVAPIDEDGFVADGHTLDRCCECNPRIEQTTTDGRLIVPLYIHGEEIEAPNA